MMDIKSVMISKNVISQTALTGEIRLINQRLSSEKEDIILNTIVANAEQVTEGVYNINIHVPNKKNQPSGNPTAKDNTQPNVERMQDIGRVVMEVLDDYRGFDFSIHLETTGEVIPDKDKWYYNIVLRYFYLRKDKK